MTIIIDPLEDCEVTPRGIKYDTMEGYPKITAEDGKMKVTDKFIIHWSKKYDLMNEIWPPPTSIGGQFIYNPPMSYPGLPWVLAKSIAIDPFPSDLPGGVSAESNGSKNIPLAEVTLTYEAVSQDRSENNESKIKYNISVGAEMMTLPTSKLKWSDGGEVPSDAGINAARVIPHIEHQMAWERLSSLPISKIRLLIGTTNEKAFYGAAPETLLFLGATIEPVIGQSGVKFYNMTYKISERCVIGGDGKQYGWNHTFDPTTGRWRRIVSKQGNYPLYFKSNYQQLFNF